MTWRKRATTALLFYHSSCVYHWITLTGRRRGSDELVDEDPSFRPESFYRVIRASAWSG